jgi:hypothetical protein
MSMNFPIPTILAGLVLLFLGRRLFWLFVALVGFIVGMSLATQVFAVHEQWLSLLIAVGCGILGALIALFLQRFAIGIAGFACGAMLCMWLAKWIGLSLMMVIPALIGGILGAILFLVLFDWGLILFSSITGASMIVHSVRMDSAFVLPVLVVLVVMGVFVQARFIRPVAKAQNAG